MAKVSLKEAVAAFHKYQAESGDYVTQLNTFVLWLEANDDAFEKYINGKDVGGIGPSLEEFKNVAANAEKLPIANKETEFIQQTQIHNSNDAGGSYKKNIIQIKNLVDINENNYKEESDQRLSFYTPILKVQQESSIGIIEKLYTQAMLPLQKQACIRYLLHYQHYNAELNIEENQQLGYSPPLCVVQESSGYIRTEYSRLFGLVQPYINKFLENFYQKSFENSNAKVGISNFIRLSTDRVIPALKTFFSKTHRIIEIEDICLAFNENNHNKKDVVVVRVAPDDCHKTALDIIGEQFKNIGVKITPGNLRTKNPNLCFLFLLKKTEINCIMLWGVKWVRPKKDNTLKCLTIDSNELFDRSVFSLLNESGAVPDRLEVNDFATHIIYEQPFSSALKEIDINSFSEYHDITNISSQNQNWQLVVDEIRDYNLGNDEGCAIYRDAILKWQAVFFDQNSKAFELVLSLLNSQVAPWLSTQSTIVQWAKAYQNLCEILMFCLDYFPEINSKTNVQTVMLNTLDPENRFKCKSFGLHPYAMTAIFDVFYQILDRDEFREKQLVVACLSQNYFETFDLVENIMSQGSFSVEKLNSLHRMKKIPDILVADIHSNNATMVQIVENDIADSIDVILQADPKRKLILILDITLNSLTDNALQNTLDKLRDFVANGQLEIFGIQSLAKLVQLGADNFSGGACFYLGSPSDAKHFPILPKCSQRKTEFFGFLTQNFQEIIDRYFAQIRCNTDRMYNELRESCHNIRNNVNIKTSNAVTNGKVTRETGGQFCAVDIALNTDENTVYVAIGFRAFFDKINKSEQEKAGLVDEFRKLILKMARLRGLSITGRQSFGFALSNMSAAKDAIRFSIGVENEQFITQYTATITDFSLALSQQVSDYYPSELGETPSYAAPYPSDFDINAFKEKVINIYEILQNGDGPNLGQVRLLEKKYGEYGQYDDEIGIADIYFANHYLKIKKTMNKENGDKIEELLEPNIGILRDRDDSGAKVICWSYADLFRLIWQLKSISCKKIYVLGNAIGGFDHTNKFTFSGSMHDQKSGISFNFGPNFSLALRNGDKYTGNKIFVIVPQLETGPIRFSKLSERWQNGVFTLCVRRNVEVYPYKETQNSLLLVFREPKPWINYQKTVNEHFAADRLFAVVNYLNGLDVENLPLVESQFWESFAEAPESCLREILGHLGSQIMAQLTEDDLSSLSRIKHHSFKWDIIDGMHVKFANIISQGANLELDAIGIIRRFFLQDEFQLNTGYVDFKRYINALEDHIKENPNDDGVRLNHYLTAIFPLIQGFYSTPQDLFKTGCSIPLHKMADLYQPLKEHMSELESKILTLVHEEVDIGLIPVKDYKTRVMFISSPVSELAMVAKEKFIINGYLKLYVNYPLLDDIKRDFLNIMREKSEALLIKWIIAPEFYFHPLDISEINQIMREHECNDDFHLILSKHNRAEVSEFFQGMGGKNILLKLLLTEKGLNFAVSTLRWAIVIQDPELFTAALNFLKQTNIDYISDKKIIDDLQKYIPYLDKTDIMQKELLNLILSMLQQNNIDNLEHIILFNENTVKTENIAINNVQNSRKISNNTINTTIDERRPDENGFEIQYSIKNFNLSDEDLRNHCVIELNLDYYLSNFDWENNTLYSNMDAWKKIEFTKTVKNVYYEWLKLTDELVQKLPRILEIISEYILENEKINFLESINNAIKKALTLFKANVEIDVIYNQNRKFIESLNYANPDELYSKIEFIKATADSVDYNLSNGVYDGATKKEEWIAMKTNEFHQSLSGDFEITKEQRKNLNDHSTYLNHYFAAITKREIFVQNRSEIIANIVIGSAAIITQEEKRAIVFNQPLPEIFYDRKKLEQIISKFNNTPNDVIEIIFEYLSRIEHEILKIKYWQNKLILNFDSHQEIKNKLQNVYNFVKQIYDVGVSYSVGFAAELHKQILTWITPLDVEVDKRLNEIIFYECSNPETSKPIQLTCYQWSIQMFKKLKSLLESDDLQNFEPLLQQNKILLNEQDDNGMALLHLAAMNNAKSITKFLVTNENLDKELRNNDGKTALHIALEKECLELARILIENSFDVNSVILKTNVTPLHMVVDKILRDGENSKLNEFMLFLLENKADPNIKRTDSENHPTVLHAVISSDPLNKELVKMLLDSGASPFISNVLGRSAIAVAFRIVVA